MAVAEESGAGKQRRVMSLTSVSELRDVDYKRYVARKHRGLIRRTDPGSVTFVSTHLYNVVRAPSTTTGVALIPLCEQDHAERITPFD